MDLPVQISIQSKICLSKILIVLLMIQDQSCWKLISNMRLEKFVLLAEKKGFFNQKKALVLSHTLSSIIFVSR
jgi:hypothetical protein